MPPFAVYIAQVGRRGGTHSQQKRLIEQCLQDKMLECALHWRLSEFACGTHERFCRLQNLDSFLSIGGRKKIVGPPALLEAVTNFL